MKKLLKTTAGILLIITGLNALVAGFIFIVQPDGSLMGMSTEYLVSSPFRSYFIPGVILFLCNGILNLAAFIFLLRKWKYYMYWILIQGIILCVWIVIQVIMLKDLNLLHYVMFSIGMLLMFCGNLLRNIEKKILKA